MTDTKLVGLGIRIAAIFLLLHGLGFISRTLPSYLEISADDQRSLIAFWLVAILPFLIAFVLWKFPSTIAGRLLPPSTTGTPVSNITIEHAQSAALTVVGVGILAIRLPDLIFWVVYLIQLSNQDSTAEPVPADTMALIITTVVEIILGLWLTLGAQGLIGMLQRIRGRV